MSNYEITGFKFECQNCGYCCTANTKGYTYLKIDDLFELSQNLDISLNNLFNDYIEIREEIFQIENSLLKFNVFILKQINGCCIFLEGKKCKIYDYRPFFCRNYPFINEILNNKQNLEIFMKNCKGYGKGRCFSNSELKEKLMADNHFHLKLYKDSNFLKSLKIDEIVKNIKVKFENENQIIEEPALELIRNELLIESLKHYYKNIRD